MLQLGVDLYHPNPSTELLESYLPECFCSNVSELVLGVDELSSNAALLNSKMQLLLHPSWLPSPWQHENPFRLFGHRLIADDVVDVPVSDWCPIMECVQPLFIILQWRCELECHQLLLLLRWGSHWLWCIMVRWWQRSTPVVPNLVVDDF
jgi:hypothetical protein